MDVTPVTMDWGRFYVTRLPVTGADVLEVGSRDLNGSFRSIIEPLGPASYLGIDMASGPGVDKVSNLFAMSGEFDIVVCTEVLEHIEEWRAAVTRLEWLTKDNGYIVVTTRAHGFQRHDFPSDYWRFTVGDICAAFSRCHVVTAEHEPDDLGIYVILQKRADTAPAPVPV